MDLLNNINNNFNVRLIFSDCSKLPMKIYIKSLAIRKQFGDMKLLYGFSWKMFHFSTNFDRRCVFIAIPCQHVLSKFQLKKRQFQFKKSQLLIAKESRSDRNSLKLLGALFRLWFVDLYNQKKFSGFTVLILKWICVRQTFDIWLNRGSMVQYHASLTLKPWTI